MAFSVTTIGTNNSHTGATVAVTVPVGGVPSGALIVVVVEEVNSTVGGSVADSKSNSYLEIVSKQSSSSFIDSFYVKSATALVSGDTITFTKKTSGDQAVISAFYITGADATAPLDTAITATASGVGTTPSVTGGTPGATDLQVGAVAAYSATQSVAFTQDSGHGWAAPPDAVSDNVGGKGGVYITLGGGKQTSASAQTFSPTLGAVSIWQAIIFGFKPATFVPGAFAEFSPFIPDKIIAVPYQ